MSTWSHFDSNHVPDSLRTEIINGKSFVLHRIDPKETLYSISQRYHGSVDEILKYNPQLRSAPLQVGQELKIPFLVKNKPQGGKKYHTVASGETLYSIAKLYNLPVNKLKSINNLNNPTLSVGQKLIVGTIQKPQNIQHEPIQGEAPMGFHKVAPKETLYAISRMYNVTAKQLSEWNGIKENNVAVGQIIRVAGPVESFGKKDRNLIFASKKTAVNISENVVGSDETTESGFGELIEGSVGKRKYLALHNGSKTGTILKVRNALNNREVFVRVIGALPDTDKDSQVVIRVSKSALDRLGGIDARLAVEITYYK